MDVLDFFLLLMAFIMLSGIMLDKFEHHRERFIDEMNFVLKKTRKEHYKMKYCNAPLAIRKLTAVNYLRAVDILLASHFAKIFCRRELIDLFGNDFIMDIKKDDVLMELSQSDKLVMKFIS